MTITLILAISIPVFITGFSCGYAMKSILRNNKELNELIEKINAVNIKY